MDGVRSEKENMEFSAGDRVLLVNSKTEGTRRNYLSAWKKFHRWCCEQQVDPISCPLSYVINYLSHLFDTNLEYNTIAVHRSAISAQHNMVDRHKVGEHPKISQLMKGVSKLRPLQPKYCSTWNVNLVLTFIKTLGDNMTMTLMDLSQKTVFLLAITSAHRGKELHSLKLHLMNLHEEYIVFQFDVQFKTTKQGQRPKDTYFHTFKEDPILCPTETLRSLLARTQEYRTTDTITGRWLPDKIFLSTIKPHKEVSKPTLATWIVRILERAGVTLYSHTSQAGKKYSSHSTRAASCSKVAKLGLPIEDIVKQANWSQRSTFEKFYHKPIDSAGKVFQTKVLELT
jgi:hypothetical protein